MKELTKGQEWRLAGAEGQALTRVRMGLGWDKIPTAGYIGSGAPDVDLDATAVQFAGGRLFDLAFYNNLKTRDGSVEHLGDNLTGRGAGDDEVIVVDLGRVHGPVDTIVFMVSSYHGHTLEWINNAYCRLIDEGVEGADGSGTELARFTLTGGTPQTGMALAKLTRDGEGWRFHAIGEGIPATIPSESVAALQPFV